MPAAPRPSLPAEGTDEEYDKFLDELQTFHNQRGTILEKKPKVGPRPIDLHKLYKRVTEEGGYDWVSNTKDNPLAWRRMATEFLPANANMAQFAFMLKNTYYKNLVAYEIKTFHNRDPPPKEILEDVSAKGGNVLDRTVENYKVTKREVEKLENGHDSDASGDEQKTPGAPDGDKMDVDDPGSVGRGGRSLRQAPPQRVLFGSEVITGGRRSHANAHATNSPTPGGGIVTNGTYSSTGASVSIANYEPKSHAPLSVRPQTTPANNSDHFRAMARKMLAARRSARGIVMPRGMMAPGTGFNGPTIYNRTLLALRSGVPAEVRYALHHLVKISHERGDKYKFDQFVGLAEALIEKILEISELFYGFKWTISYNNAIEPEIDVLNSLWGTKGLLYKIHAHPQLNVQDGLQSDEFAQMLENINEAALVLRNMVMLDDNANYLMRMPLIRDLTTIILNLPQRSMLVELRHYCLDWAEQLTKYWLIQHDDPLYVSLLTQLNSNDRGVIVTTLRAVARISMSLEARNRMPGISLHHLQRVCDWLFVEDEELRHACLDFLNQFTTEVENVRFLLTNINMEPVLNQLTKNLLHGAKKVESQDKVAPTKALQRGADGPPKLSKSIMEQICLVDGEREQSSAWLKTCFERDDNGEITQLQLWTSYNEAFSQLEPKRSLMQAKDFIQNVSQTFNSAQAQVVANPEDPKKPRYTIKGIRPRAVPVDSRGRPFIRCLWRTPVMMSTEGIGGAQPRDLRNYEECDMSVARPEEIWDHVLASHLNVQKDPLTGRYMGPQINTNGTSHQPSSTNANPDAMDTEEPDSSVLMSPPTLNDIDTTYQCHWSTCKHFTYPQTDATLVIRHVQTHLPDTGPMMQLRWVANRTVDNLTLLDQQPINKITLNTLQDERNDAAGLPFAAVCVLRNLARQMRKIDAGEADARKFSGVLGAEPEQSADTGVETESGSKDMGWVEKSFLPVRDRMFHAMAFNQSLPGYLATVLATVDGGL